MIVLGIDAAWTSTQPTGVALVRRRNGAWETLGVASSYTSFINVPPNRMSLGRPEGLWGPAPTCAVCLLPPIRSAVRQLISS